MSKDKITYQVSRAINSLFLYNWTGTCYGILLGITIMGFQKLIAEYFPPFGLIEWYAFIAFGVLFFNIKPMITKKYLDPNIEQHLVYIRKIIKEGKFTESEERTIWRKSINIILSEYNQTARNDESLNNPTPG